MDLKKKLPAFFATLLLAPAAECASRVSAELRGLMLTADETGAVLEWRLSARRSPNVLRLGHPERLVIDLPATHAVGLVRPRAPIGIVAAVRAAPRGGGAFRVVLELGRGAASGYRLSSVAVDGAVAYRLELGATPAPSGDAAAGSTVGSGAATAAVAAATPGGQATSTGPAVPATRVIPAHGRDIVVAVDAGHGGEDPGASGPGGTHEKDVVLPIARELAAQIERMPGFRAVLTRRDDHFVDLRDRVERAHAARADLFISVHADSVRDHDIAGASVYTLSYHGASSETARMLADRENAAVLKGGVSLAGVDPQLASVLLDVAKEAAMGSSVEAADQVLAGLDRVGLVRKREVQHAGFVVLKSLDIPSMLVETAYISNAREERKLRSPAYQQRLAAAIASGLVAYFREHPPDGTRP